MMKKKTIGEKTMGSKNQNGDKGRGWTPEQILQAVKEGVTALLGIILVGYTLNLASRVFTYVGDPDKLSDAKDVLMLMLGLAGVVIGYYFGRVPADARATQAQEQAYTATAQAEQVRAKAQPAADQVNQFLARLATPAGAEAREALAPAGIEDVVKEMTSFRDMVRQV
jgi:hypothetical protein